jgi:hypothetical protein
VAIGRSGRRSHLGGTPQHNTASYVSLRRTAEVDEGAIFLVATEQPLMI